MPTSPIRYKAFISYSHTADHRLAPSLQRALEKLAKPWYRPRAIEVFRDVTNLAASPEAWPDIQAALRSSEFFILLASPTAAASKWVRREVDFWLENKDKDALLIALTDGSIAWSHESNNFDWQATTALPRNLDNVFEHEPLHVDLRKFQGREFTLKDDDFQDHVASIAAGLYRVDKSSIYGRHIAEHRRTVLTAASTMLGLAIAILLATTLAYLRQVEIENRRLANRYRYVTEINLADRALRDGDTRQAAEIRSVLDAEQFQPFRSIEIPSLNRRLDERSLVLARESGDSKAVHSLALFNGGSSVLYGLADGTAKVVKIENGQPRELLSLAPKLGPVTTVAVSRDESILATGHQNSSIRLWDALTGSELKALEPGPGRTWRVAFSPDGKFLVSGGWGNNINVWSVEAGNGESVLDTRANVWGLAFTPDGEHLIVGENDRISTLAVQRAGPYSLVGEANRWLSGLRDIRISPDARTMIVVLTSGVRIYDIRSVKEIGTVQQEPGTEYECAAISSDGQLLALGGSTRGDQAWLALWDLSDSSPQSVGRMIRTFHGHTEKVTGVAFSADDHYLVSGSADGTVRRWDLNPVEYPLEILAERLAFSSSGSMALIQSASADSEGTYPAAVAPVVTGGGDVVDPSIPVDQVFMDFEQAPFPTDDDLVDPAVTEESSAPGATEVPSGLSLLPHPEVPLTTETLGMTIKQRIHIFDQVSENSLVIESPHISKITGLEVSPSGKLLLTAAADNVIVWNVSDGSRKFTLNGAGIEAAFDRGETLIAAFSLNENDQSVVIFDARTGQQLRRLGDALPDLESIRGPSIVFSISGDRLYIAGQAPKWDTVQSPAGPIARKTLRGNAVTVWDVASGKLLQKLEGHGFPVRSVAVSNDGKWLATAARERADHQFSGLPGELYLWNTRDGKLVHRLRGHLSGVNAVAFTPDSLRVVSGSGDDLIRSEDRNYEVRVWDVETGTELFGVASVGGEVDEVAVARDLTLAVQSGGGVRIWPANDKAELLLNGFKSAASSQPDSSAAMRLREWRLSQARACAETNHLYGMEFYLRRVKDATALEEQMVRGQHAAVRQAWLEAAEHFAAAAQEDPDSSASQGVSDNYTDLQRKLGDRALARYREALAYFELGKRDEFHSRRQTWLHAWTKERDQQSLQQLGLLCALTAGEWDETQSGQLVELAVACENAQASNHLVAAAIFFRLGKTKEAAEAFEKALQDEAFAEANGWSSSALPYWAIAFWALVDEAEGRLELARARLHEAQTRHSAIMKSGIEHLHWEARLVRKSILAEASHAILEAR